MGVVGGTVVFVVLLWWSATGALLYVNRLEPTARAWAALALMLIAAASLAGLPAFAADASVAGHLTAFAAAMAIWALNEHLFLMGWVTGPRRTAVPPGLTGWVRFAAATRIVIWHELALALSLAAVAFTTWGAPQQTAALAFAVLFAMRLSAKLNLFLGVPNSGAEFLPPRLAYLASCFRERRLNPLFPLSILIGSAILALAVQAIAGAGSDGARAGAAALAALTALALIEHVFMVVPFRSARLWLLADRRAAGPAGPPLLEPLAAGPGLAAHQNKTQWR